MGTKTNRVITALALSGVVFGLSFGSAVAGSSPTTVATLSPATIAAGKAYATKLLDEQPVPSGATSVRRLPTPVYMQAEELFSVGNEIVSRDFLIPSSVDIDQFVSGHLRKGESVTGTGTVAGPNTSPVFSVTVSLACVSRHVTYCNLEYQTTISKSGQQELRVDLQVDWLPIVVVKMPTTGVVTVTGYDKTSVAEGSRGPVKVVLTHDQALKLRGAIASLKESGGGFCMEDSTLLKIAISSGSSNSPTWSAVGDECPGALSIDADGTRVGLDDHSCSFWRVVSTLFPAGEADATKGSASCKR